MFKFKHTAAAISAGLVLALSGCSMQTTDTGMTDEEIMAAIEAGDAETLRQSKAATDEAIKTALESIDEFTDEERDALRASIMAEVDKRLSGIGGTTVNKYVTEQHPTYVTENKTYVTEEHPTYVTENTYITQGEEKPPRIEDGTEISAEWNIEKVYKEGELTFTVGSIEAHAYNYAPDTPYAGGGYAYRIVVTVRGSIDRPAPEDGQGTGIAGSWNLPADMMFAPYDLRMGANRWSDCDYDANAFINTYSIPVNMLPERIYAAAEE